MLKEEAEMVHEPEHWEKLHMLMEMEQKEMDAAAEEMNSIYLNPFSLDCALLAAGGVLQTVDKVNEEIDLNCGLILYTTNHIGTREWGSRPCCCQTSRWFELLTYFAQNVISPTSRPPR